MYVPTDDTTNQAKEKFLDDLKEVVGSFQNRGRILFLGNFNERMRKKIKWSENIERIRLMIMAHY